MNTSNWADAKALRTAFDACKRHLAFLFGFSAGLNLLYLAPAIYMMQVYDRVLQSGSVWTLIFLTVAMIASLAVLAALDGVRAHLMGAASRRLDRIVAPQILTAVMQGRAAIPGAPTQSLQSFDVFRAAVSGPPAMAAADAPWSILFVVVCFMIHPWVGVLVLIGGAALVAVAYFNEMGLRPLLKAQEQTAGGLYGLVGGDAMKAETARALGMAPRLVGRQLDARVAFTEAQASATAVASNFTALTKFLRLVLQSGALGLGAYLAIRQEISPGAVIAASILTARALAPLEQVVGAWRQMGQAIQALATVRTVLIDADTESARIYTTLPAPRGEVILEQVCVNAPGGQARILDNISARIAPGEVVGVIGPSGAGKSTLVRALVGAIACDEGAVRLDGAKLTDWPPDTLGEAIGYLAQDVGLFSGTVGDNIARFRPRSPACDAAVVAAAQAANVHRFVLSLPQGYDTMLGPGGRGLSAGQAQRIGLARALFGDPKVIVLDEPNAHLDGDGEAALIEAMKGAKARGAAIVIVAHRAGIMSIADKLLVLRDGRMDGFGPRDQVIQKLASVGGARPMTPAPHAGGATAQSAP